MKKIKTEQTKERNRTILSHMKSLVGSGGFRGGFLEMSTKFGMTVSQVKRVYSKMSSHLPIDKLGNPIGKDHWKIHTHEWWVE